MPFLGILSRNGQMILKVKVNDPHFQYQPTYSQDAYWVQIWWFYLKSITCYCKDKPNFLEFWDKKGNFSLKMWWVITLDKPNFLEFWVKIAKMTLKVKFNYLHFQYQLRVSHDAYLEQIWWFQSYRADKLKFTDRRTEEAGNDNTQHHVTTTAT